MVRAPGLQREGNSYFHYGGIDGRDPAVTAAPPTTRPGYGETGPYFRLVQPYQHHTNIPDEETVEQEPGRGPDLRVLRTRWWGGGFFPYTRS